MESEEIILTTEQKDEFRHLLMIAGYRQLYENGFITLVQLEALLKIHERSDNA